MSRCLSCLAFFAVLACVVSPVLATPLDTKQNEWAFDISWIDTDDVGSTTIIDGQWQWILAKGRHEIGAVLTYFKDDPDFGVSTDGTIIGPVYTWNWMPDKPTTGYLTGSYGFVSGDLGDTADAAWLAGVGAKMFVGDSAAVRFEFFIQKVMGADGFADEDSKGISIGISIFSGKQK